MDGTVMWMANKRLERTNDARKNCLCTKDTPGPPNSFVLSGLYAPNADWTRCASLRLHSPDAEQNVPRCL